MTDLLIHLFPRPTPDAPYRVEVTVDELDPVTEQLKLALDTLDATEHSHDPATYGMALFDLLFQGRVRRVYDRAVGMARQRGDRLRVRLWIESAARELHGVPWERLYHFDETQEVALAANGKTPFSRYVGVEGLPAPPPLAARPLKLLFVVANPHNLPPTLPPIDVAAQVQQLQQALGALRRAGRYTVSVLAGRTGLAPTQADALRAGGFTLLDGPATLDEIVRQLPDFHLLHLLAHGSWLDGQSWLHLEGEQGEWVRCPAATLVDKVAKVTPQPHLIFLAACDSAKSSPDAPNAWVGLGPHLVQAGIPAVIAMQDQVASADAQQLTGDFYRRLLEQGVVDEALNAARNVLMRPNNFDWAIPVLFMRLRHGQLLAEAPLPPTRLIPVPPASPPATFGRAAFLAQLSQDLATMPVIALRGPAGVGKSHLALALANAPAVVAAFPAGRAWLELGPEAELFTALGHLLSQLGAPTEAVKSVEERAALLRTLLADQPLLLLLDDVWQVAHAKPFLDACQPPTRVVLTTRSAQLADDLHAANHEVPVLERPPAVAMLAAAGPSAAEAVQLDPTGAVQLANQLGDLPLALHVAGRWLNSVARSDGAAQAVAQLHAAVQEETEVVLQQRAAARRPGLADAQPTLEAVLDLSYRALSPAAQRALRQLAVFGPQPWHFAAGAMQAVWQVDNATARELRGALVDAGLLTRLPAPAENGALPTSVRYALHQVVAAFASVRLSADKVEARAAHLAHAAHYATVVADWNDAIAKGTMTYAAPAEWENVARAVEWLAPQVTDDAAAAEALLAFTRHWRTVLLNNYDPRRTRWLALGVAAAQRTQNAWDLANTLRAQGDVYHFLDRDEKALAVYEQALSLFRTVGDRLGEANTLKAQGDVYRFLDRNEEALAVYDQALSLYRTVGDRLGEANTLKAQGDVYRFLDRNEEALAVYDQALSFFRTVGDRLGEANTLKAQGDLAFNLGEDEHGAALYDEARQLYQAVGDRVGPVNIGIKLAYRAAEQGDLATAIAYLQPAADFCNEIGHPLGAELQAQIEEWKQEVGIRD